MPKNVEIAPLPPLPVSEYMQRAKRNTAAGAVYNLTSSGLHLVKASELTDSLDILDDKEFPYGFTPVLEQLAKHTGLSQQQIFTVTGGTSMANFMVFEALIRPGDHVIIEQPAYPLIYDLARHKRAQISEVPRSADRGFELDLNKLEDLITSNTKLIVLTNLHNPSGYLMTTEALRAVGKLAKKHRAKILIDEVYLDAAWEAAPKSAAHLGDEFIVTNSLTKVYGLGFLRAGWILGSQDFIKYLWSLYDVVGVVPPTVNDRLQLKAWEKFPMIASRSQKLLTENHVIWNSFLYSNSDVITVRSPYGTTAFPTLLNANERTITRLESYLLKHYETGIVHGKFFGAPSHFRVSLCCDTQMLKDGLARLSDAVKERSTWDR